jgi:hypothetical protein
MQTSVLGACHLVVFIWAIPSPGLFQLLGSGSTLQSFLRGGFAAAQKRISTAIPIAKNSPLKSHFFKKKQK